MVFVLGLDIGTTSVKTMLVNYESGAIIASQSEETKAYTKSGALHTAAAEQAVSFIFRAIDRAMKRLPRDTVSHVKAIGVCGQMHGCMLWKRNCIDLLLEKLTTFDRMVDCLTDDNVMQHRIFKVTTTLTIWQKNCDRLWMFDSVLDAEASE